MPFSLLLCLSLFAGCTVPSSPDASILFYNVENLYDFQNDPDKDDEVFLPAADRAWNAEKYARKLDQLAKVISVNGLPAIIGLCEVENKQVVEDLILTDDLEPVRYGIVHFDSPDERGIDCALLYDKDRFKLKNSFPLHVTLPGDRTDYTRDILYVSGEINISGKKETIHFFVNHWPSRQEGVEISAPKRMAAAITLRNSVDSLFAKYEDPHIVIMGDFNDTPFDISIMKGLKAKELSLAGERETLINLLADKQQNGVGTYNFKGKWQALDQLIISSSLLDHKKTDVSLPSVQIVQKDWMMFTHEKYGLSPDRTYAGTKYIGGFSDHLPVYMELIFY